jgi:hypothetical protein
MINFVPHIISQGETMQSIAQDELGDMTLWVTIAQFNNLKYPYIVATVSDKLADLDHLVTVGDTIYIKVTDDTQATLIQSLSTISSYDKDALMALALGKDLDILPLNRTLLTPGQGSEIFAMKSDGNGAVKTVGGVANLLQSLYIRVITPKGSYLGHPTYGSDVDLYIGKKNTEENATLLDLEIERTLRTDSRVTNVEFQGHDLVDNSYTAYFDIYTLNLDQAFQFVVSSINQGPLVLLNNFNSNGLNT